MQEKLSDPCSEWFTHVISKPEYYNVGKGDEGITIWGEHEGERPLFFTAHVCSVSTVWYCPLKTELKFGKNTFIKSMNLESLYQLSGFGES